MKLLLTSIVALTASVAAAQEVPQASNQWYSDAQATLQEMLARQQNTNRARNVILFVADGNGIASNYATRIFTGQQQGGYGDEYVQPHEAFPYLALVKTYTTNGQTPDSAPTAAAFNSGVKSKNDTVNMTDVVAVDDCEAAAANPVTLLSELMSESGRSVGIVSTARLTHATPAAVYARSANRDWEEDTLVPEGCGQLDIASQLVEQMNKGVIDVALGGGRANFIPAGIMDAEGKEGDRGDGRNLAEEIVGDTGVYVQTQEEFDALDTATIAGPVLGLFEPSHMLYEADRAGEPSLAEMTRSAIEILSRNEQGYYLMVEAGRVDHALHDGNLGRAVRDGVAFADAIALADELTDDTDTLIVVTADHDHGLQFNGYCGRGSNILGLCMDVDTAGVAHTGEAVLADDGKPYTVAGFMNGKGSILKAEEAGGAATQVQPAHTVAIYVNADGSVLVDPADAEDAMGTEVAKPEYSGTRPVVTEEEATHIDYLQQALLPRESETHSGTEVALYAKGPWAHVFDGTIEQNVIFHVMLHAASAGQ